MLAFLKSTVPRLHEIAVKHGTTLRVRIGEPAAESQLRELEAFVGEPLPNSLRSFLRETNGVGISFHDRADSAPFPIELYKLDLHGTDTIQSETRDMRSYIDMDPYDEFARALRCFDVANISGGLSRVVFSLDAVSSPNEYAIFNADLDTNQWIEDLRGPVDSAIAPSYKAFVTQAIRHMLDTELGFDVRASASDESLWPA